MKKQTIITMMAAWMMMASATAQTVTPGFEIGELIRIGNAYRQVPYLSFDIEYQYADSTAPTVILEEINGQYKMHEGRYWAMIDSTEFVQGYNYSLAIFHEDKVISVHKPENADNRILQIPVIDSMISNYIDSVRISQPNDSTRLLKLYFKSSMQYSGYEMQYNSTNYLVNSVKYFMRNYQDSTTSLIKASMTHYSRAIVAEDYFSESKFIYKDGTFYKRPDYSDYEIVVNGDLK